jgi:hypothetical protein
VQDPNTGVMAGTLYMAAQIEGSLAQSAQPPVGSAWGLSNWSPTESTTQQLNP